MPKVSVGRPSLKLNFSHAQRLTAGSVGFGLSSAELAVLFEGERHVGGPDNRRRADTLCRLEALDADRPPVIGLRPCDATIFMRRVVPNGT